MVLRRLTKKKSSVLDASAIVALFEGHGLLMRWLEESDRDERMLILPTAAMAEAETSLRAGYLGWAFMFLSAGVQVLHLDQSTSISVGGFDGPLGARHARQEADAVRATIITRRPADYDGMPGSLFVV